MWGRSGELWFEVSSKLGGIPERRFSENFEYINPEMRETEFSVSERGNLGCFHTCLAHLN